MPKTDMISLISSYSSYSSYCRATERRSQLLSQLLVVAFGVNYYRDKCRDYRPRQIAESWGFCLDPTLIYFCIEHDG